MKLTDMPQQIDRLDWSIISDQLADQVQVLRHYEIHEVISSTNDLALEQCGMAGRIPAVYFAEHQESGRGRRGREWFSPHSSNIYMSLAWPLSVQGTVPGGLSIAMGVAVARGLNAFGLDVGLKWPNDVMVSGRKIAGILIETRMRAGGDVQLVIGVGINFAMPRQGQVQTVIDQPWTDFVSEYREARRVTRNELAGHLLKQLLMACQQYEQTGIDPFLTEWRALDVCLGCRIDILLEGATYSGEMLGIEPDGAVRVRIDDEDKIFHSAQISLRPRS